MRGPTKESPESPFLEGWGGRDKGPRREQRPPSCRAPPHSDQPADGSRCCMDIRLSGASLQGPSREPSTSQMGTRTNRDPDTSRASSLLWGCTSWVLCLYVMRIQWGSHQVLLSPL